MKRREALKHTAAMMGISILGADIFLSGCTSVERKIELFSESDIVLMDEIGEAILPDSERSPGAKAAQIGIFMEAFVTDCYGSSDQKIFQSGLREINNTSIDRFGMDFLKISAQQRFDLLSDFDKESREHNGINDLHFFSMLKQITILGYFSSEVGVTKAMRYNPVPGHYDGCFPYKKGDRAWVGYLSSIG